MRFSVVIPAHNAERFLATTLRSMDRQDTRPDEVIVVDDGSTDATRRIAEEFRFGDGSTPVVLAHDVSRGAAVARNHGVFAARAEWVGLCDADDLWRPNRVSAILAAADTDASVVGIGTRARGFALESDRADLRDSPRAGMVGEWVPDAELDRWAAVPATVGGPPREVTLADLQDDVVFVTTLLAYRREAWAMAGGCATWSHLADDYVLNAAIASVGRILELPADLALYRVRPKSLSDDAAPIAVPYLAANVAARFGGGTRPSPRAGHLYRHLLALTATRRSTLTLREVLGFALLGGASPREAASLVKRRIRAPR